MILARHTKLNIFIFPILSEYIGLSKVLLHERMKNISNTNSLSLSKAFFGMRPRNRKVNKSNWVAVRKSGGFQFLCFQQN